MAADLFQETGLLIHQDGVKPDPGTDEDFFHTVKRSDFFQDTQIRAVVSAQSGAWLRRDALAVFADPPLLLFGTARFKEICCRSTEVMDISFEIRVRDQGLGFVQNRRFAAPGDDPSMMEGDGAEMATTVATAMAVDRKAHFFDRRYAALGHIRGVDLAGKWQGEHLVQLRGRQRGLGWILDQVAVTVALDQGFAIDRSLFVVLQPESCGIEPFVLADFVEAWQQDVGRIFRKRTLQQFFPVLAQAGKRKSGSGFDKIPQIGRQAIGPGQHTGAGDFIDLVNRHAFFQ